MVSRLDGLLVRVFLAVVVSAWVIFALLLVGPAFAQEAAETAAPDGIVPWLMDGKTWALAVPLFASLATAIFRDNPHVMKLVNILALNVGRARNDPAAQR